jgi:hypothetical protein
MLEGNVGGMPGVASTFLDIMHGNNHVKGGAVAFNIVVCRP